jgi:hypothetical protein
MPSLSRSIPAEQMQRRQSLMALVARNRLRGLQRFLRLEVSIGLYSFFGLQMRDRFGLVL